jgi:DmsE family decaheme c-type cytochrome
MRNTEALVCALMAIAAVSAAGQDSPSTRAGSEACQACHEDISNAFAKNPHHSIETDSKRGWKGQACESCHGPAQKHTESASVEDILNPAKLTAVAADKICLSCHLNQPTHVGRLQSSHAKDQVSCTTCHKVHANGPFGLVARKAAAVNAQCATCHTSVWSQFQKPFKHRLPEGAMSCVDCHNPHATFTADSMRSSFGNEPGCLECHSDKRGPFVFEHAPMRLEGCAACHEPHGSANPRMLVRHEQSLVCLECHANLSAATANGKIGGVPPAFHDLRSSRFQNCTVCHSKIHGSYVDRTLLR